MRIHARHYATAEPIELRCSAGVIRAVTPQGPEPPDLRAGWVGPALFDLQINGCHGFSFNSEELTIGQIRHVVAICRRHGVSAFCPTVTTNSFAALAHGLTTIRQACDTDADLANALPAIHLEGPYLAADDGPRGAHPRQHVRPPDWDEFRRLQDAAGGRIRLVTLAPEHDGSPAFIERLNANGVVVALGHTAAGPARIRSAIAAGASLSTHLGNGSHLLMHRHENHLWEQLAADDMFASIICDGHHLPAAMVKCLLRAKTPARTILTCDAGPLAGSPPGQYRQWGQDFEVLPEGKIVVTGTSFLAGSWAFTDRCLGNVIRFAGVTLAEAIDMASAQPRTLLGLPAHRLEANAPADLMLFDWEPGGDVRVTATLIGGEAAAGPEPLR